MTTPDTLELRRKAEACLHGDPWYREGDLCGRQTFEQFIRQDRAFIAAANPAVILALLDRLDALEAHGVWWKTVIGEGDAHQPSGEIRSIKHMHPLMVKPFYEAHKGDAIGDIIAGLIFNLEITQNRETFLVEDANERLKAAEDALEGRGAWQPIETAPRDGTLIMTWCVHVNAEFCEDAVAEGYAGPVIARWIDHNGGGFTWHGLAGEHTNWRPLPEAPTTLADEG